MRVVMYNWLFIADNAAIRITKFITPVAPGIPMACMTVTNGLWAWPAWTQGTIASINARVSR
ncbi:hypothetical protein D3C78_1282620 [compost metagenome]